MSDSNNDSDKAAKIAAIKARMAQGSKGGDKPAEQPAAAASGGGGAGAGATVVPDGDKAALMAAIKARAQGGPRAVIEGKGSMDAPAAASAAPLKAATMAVPPMPARAVAMSKHASRP